jgi:sodium/pantothenate symporter
MTSHNLLAVSEATGALWAFLIYTVAGLTLAVFAGRLLRSKNFLREYFLGSRDLGMWAFALTFAATSASGGTFIGFPALIYSHGWIMALWIASYMVYPLCTMGILGKRINQVARKTDAITVPDVLRDRFESPAFGIVATCLIVFFLSFNMVAQFKGATLILQELLGDVGVFQDASAQLGAWVAGDGYFGQVEPAYLMSLLIFGATMLFYTTVGGFRADVWTDVMQGAVMLVGVAIMLPLAISAVGGLEEGTRRLSELVPERRAVVATLQLPDHSGISDENTLRPGDYTVNAGNEPRSISVLQPVTVRKAVPTRDVPLLEHRQRPTQVKGFELPSLIVVSDVRPADHDLVTGPGPSKSVDGFLPLGMAISFYCMWAISGTGQPQYMVRLMAFKDSKTLRRAIITVTLYYGAIYLPLVVIFCCARVLLPGLEDQPDKIMPKMAVFLTEGIGAGWLAGVLIAAPFAAVMSTVDSFLLVIASAVVRDLYQRNINPDVSEKWVKRLSYLTVLAVGLGAMLFAVNPPQFLQNIIVYVGSGLAACFLFPVLAAMYVPRANVAGCLSGMIVGFLAHLTPHVIAKVQGGTFATPIDILGCSPLMFGLAASLLTVLIVTPLTPRPAEHLVRRYFYKNPHE